MRAALFVVALAVAGPSVAGQSAEVSQFELDNGMKVLVRVDPRAPVVVSQVWYGIGSVDEHRGVTGISHVLEHMMFKGTDDLEPGEFAEIVQRHGGEHNAFTGRGYTGYYQQIAAEHLELLFRLEADRMSDLALDQTEFERERSVVLEERAQRVEDNPHALTQERLRATAFPSSTARNPVIGWPADLESMSLDQVATWYGQWYAPNNAALVVVGDVDPQRVHTLAQQYFGDKAPTELPPRPPRGEVEPRGEARIEVQAPANVPYLAMGWRVPSLVTAEDPTDAYALDVLVEVLDGGRSARIERELVRGSAVASSAGAGYSMLSRTDELLMMAGAPAQERSVEDLEQALREQVERLKDGEIGAEELERVKTNVRASEVFQRDSMFYQAMRIGLLETIGVGQDAYDAYREGIEAVTADDVRRVAEKYLTDERLTVAELVPTSVESGSAPPAPASDPASPGGDAIGH
ncbi:MAG: pitrilysin family protein [Halofilum sp. (in: g-proteobacteria)]